MKIFIMIIFILSVLLILWFITCKNGNTKEGLKCNHIIPKHCYDVPIQWYDPKEFITNRSVSINDKKIPKIIFQTNEKYVLSGMKDAIMSWVEMNQDYQYRYFDSNDCRDFIASNFNRDVLDAYDTLIPGAYKADLWRYCILYINGGVYADSAMICKTSLRDFIDKDDEFITAIDQGVKGGIYNAFICSTQKNPILKRAIDLVVQRVSNREYGYRDLYPTGPIALGDAINDILGRERGTDFSMDNNTHQLKLLIRRDMIPVGIVYDSSGRELIITKYDCFILEKKTWSKLPSYSDLWRERKIYRF